MYTSVHKHDVTKISRYDGLEITMVSVHVGTASLDFFVTPAQADILFPALQKVYENAENAPKI